MVRQREFDADRDFDVMRRLAARRTAVMGVGTNLHPGDIAHRIWNGNRLEDPIDVVPTWVSGGELVAFAILIPKFQAFDLVVEPDLGAGDLESILDRTIELARDDRRVETDVIGDDPSMTSRLRSRGFALVPDEGFGFTARRVDGPSEPGDSVYELRSAAWDDADRLAAVHSAAFGSSWTGDMYRIHMERNRGYTPEWELVAVAPDGTFAGFTEMWLDRENGIGHFEPVGVHPDHHRRGVGRMLLAEGMNRMGAAGMETATVWHDLADERSTAFYAACGFERVATVSRWVREG